MVKELAGQYGDLLPPLGDRAEGQAAPSVQEAEDQEEVEVKSLDWQGVAVTQLLGEKDEEGKPHGEVGAPPSIPCQVLLCLLEGQFIS